MSSELAMIEVRNLTKRYGDVVAIRDISFTATTDQILGFLGPNGAGKSTTMRILAGCLAPTAGTARIAGYDIFEESLEARRSLGYLPEQVPLYPEMRVEEYLTFAASLRMSNPQALSKRLGEVVARCGLTEVRRTLIGSLSRGYRQRVGLAQAMLPNPPVLILDEPTVGLDPRQIIEVRELIRELSGDHTVLLSTHILPEVSMLCSRVVIIDHGRIVAEDTPDNLTRPVRGGERLILDVEGLPDAVAECLRGVSGVASVEAVGRGAECVFRSAYPTESRAGPPLSDTHYETRNTTAVARYVLQTTSGDEAFARGVRRAIAGTLVSAGFGLLELRAERLTLEDIFVRLVTTEAA
ncbi:MAG: ABC transporter ATP-binding protein [Candidatus Binatia bacterium]